MQKYLILLLLPLSLCASLEVSEEINKHTTTAFQAVKEEEAPPPCDMSWFETQYCRLRSDNVMLLVTPAYPDNHGFICFAADDAVFIHKSTATWGEEYIKKNEHVIFNREKALKKKDLVEVQKMKLCDGEFSYWYILPAHYIVAKIKESHNK